MAENISLQAVHLPPCLYLLTKNCPERHVAEVFISNDDNLSVFRKLMETPLDRAVGLLAIDHQVHILRETDLETFVLAGRTYDLLKNELTDMAACPLNNMHVVAEVDGIVFALGFVGTTVYRYLDETDEWMSVSPLLEWNIVHGAVSLNERLYVIGETNQPVMQMQVYDHSTDTWRMVSPPNLRRFGPKAVVYHGKIFLLGGIVRDEFDEDVLGNEVSDEDDLGNEVIYDAADHGDNIDIDDDIDDDSDDCDMDDDLDHDDFHDDHSRHVEVYDPANDEWVVYPELPFACKWEVAVVIRGRLYVYNTDQRRKAVAYWDGSGQWKVVDNPQSQMFQYCFCAIEKEEVVREMMKRNREAIASAWQETGLEREME